MTDVTTLCNFCKIPIGLCVCIDPEPTYETRDGYFGHPVDYAPSNMNLPVERLDWHDFKWRSMPRDLFFVFRHADKWLTVAVYEADLRTLDFNADDIAAHAIVSACSTAGVGKSELTLVGGLRG